MEIKVVLGFKKASSSNRKNEIQKEIKGIERGKSKMVDYAPGTVSYTHLRAHETLSDLVCRLLLEKIFFFNDTATTEIYTRLVVGSVRCV